MKRALRVGSVVGAVVFGGCVAVSAQRPEAGHMETLRWVAGWWMRASPQVELWWSW